ncbi:MAG: hypothetical protein ACOCWL_01090 [Thermoguttaceae bacterium]
MSWLSKPLCLLLVACGLLAYAPRVLAIGQFKDEFEVKYVKPESIEPKDVAFAAAVAKARCNVCHVGISKKDHNPYGLALAGLLDRRADRDNKAKIQAVLDQVAAMKSDADNDDSVTFGELIDQGKLPGGNGE